MSNSISDSQTVDKTPATSPEDKTKSSSTVSIQPESGVTNSPAPSVSSGNDSLGDSPTSGGYYVFIIIYLVLLSAFGSFVNDMYIPTLPEMVKAFGCSVSTCQLGLTFGMIGLGVGEILLGPLSDRYGRKPILIIALIIFAIGAFCSIWSRSIQEFIWWRLVQGLGASGGYFLARTIPADMYRGRNLAKVMALVGAINGFAPASAPVIGGFVGRAVGWRGIFWILFGFSLLLLLLAPAFKESLPKNRRVDGKRAFGNYLILARNKNFVVHVLLKGAALGMLFAYISAAPFIIQDHYHYTQLQFGLFMGFNALFVAAGAMTALKFKPLKRAATFSGRLLFLIAIGQFICLYLVDSVWVYEAWNVATIFFMGMLFTVANTLAMNEGRDCAGDASALVGFVGYVFGAIASPLVGLGDILHSTAIVLLVMAFITLIFTRMAKVLPPDLEATPQSACATGVPRCPSGPSVTTTAQ